jgi:hypothetical protein
MAQPPLYPAEDLHISDIKGHFSALKKAIQSGFDKCFEGFYLRKSNSIIYFQQTFY